MSRSPFHGLAKHVLEIDSDDDGTASRLAAILDQWRAQRDRVAPDQIPNWMVPVSGIAHLGNTVLHSLVAFGQFVRFTVATLRGLGAVRTWGRRDRLWR